MFWWRCPCFRNLPSAMSGLLYLGKEALAFIPILEELILSNDNVSDFAFEMILRITEPSSVDSAAGYAKKYLTDSNWKVAQKAKQYLEQIKKLKEKGSDQHVYGRIKY